MQKYWRRLPRRKASKKIEDKTLSAKMALVEQAFIHGKVEEVKEQLHLLREIKTLFDNVGLNGKMALEYDKNCKCSHKGNTMYESQE